MPVPTAGGASRALCARLGCALGLSALALGFTPSTAHTQVTRTEGRNFSIAYPPGDATRNGYMDAQLEGTYYFAVCAGQVAFLARYNSMPQMLVGNHRYWVDGRQVSVPPHINPPRIDNPVIRGTIRGPETVREINYVYATSAPTPSCLTGDLPLGTTNKFWPAGTATDRQIAILNQFGLDYRSGVQPLRNTAVEGHFRQIFAQERTDSLNKARAAEQQRLVAQRDSTTRARATQARQDSLARAEAQWRAAQSASSSAQGGATGAASGASSGGSSTGTAAGGGSTAGGSTAEARAASQAEREAAAQAQRDAAARAEREAAADAAARDARIRQQHAAEQERLRVEQEEQMVEAVEAGTMAVIGIFESMAESRRIKAEKDRVRYEAAQRAANTRYNAYAATAKARFDAAPARPACSTADVRDSLVLSRKTETRTLRITGNECRLAQGQSAVLITLVVDSDVPVSITASSGAVLANAQLLNEDLKTAVTAKTEGGFTMPNLDRGRYTLVVSSRLAGEVGDVTLAARKLWVSDAQGSLGGAMGPAKQIDGFVGSNQTTTAFMDLSLGLQHRAKFPYVYTQLLIPYDTDASEYMIDIGLRQYIGRSNARLSPWIEASLGYRHIAVLSEPFTTISPAFGVGVNWRFSQPLGLAFSATQVTGNAKNNEDIWTSAPPPVPLNRTIFRLGLMFQ